VEDVSRAVPLQKGEKTQKASGLASEHSSRVEMRADNGRLTVEQVERTKEDHIDCLWCHVR
jgi:hypothetical protein